MPTQINGLPAHVLIVHAVVVLVPLAALVLVLASVWPTFRRRAGIAVPLLALVALICVPFATEAGEWLEARVPGSELVQKHTQLGGTLLPWVIGLFVVSAVTWLLAWWTERNRSGADAGPRRSTGLLVVRIVVAVVAVAVAVGTVAQVYRIGESGSRAAWHGRVDQTVGQYDTD
ncbi:MAG: DUF2231 domain-containing protein [Actinocatenispora sp.]